jgi:hypothetical protein
VSRRRHRRGPRWLASPHRGGLRLLRSGSPQSGMASADRLDTDLVDRPGDPRSPRRRSNRRPVTPKFPSPDALSSVIFLTVPPTKELRR